MSGNVNKLCQALCPPRLTSELLSSTYIHITYTYTPSIWMINTNWVQMWISYIERGGLLPHRATKDEHICIVICVRAHLLNTSIIKIHISSIHKLSGNMNKFCGAWWAWHFSLQNIIWQNTTHFVCNQCDNTFAQH